MGPGRAPLRPGGITGPGGIGGPAGGISGPGRSAAFGPNSSGRPGGQPNARGPEALASQANLIRNNYNFYGAFSGDWWSRHSGAWSAAGWATAAAAAYSYPTSSRAYRYCGYSTDPYYYDYGSNVVYQREYVYVDGEPVAAQDQYAQQAKTIADTGRNAQAGAEEEWLALGVFAMTRGGQVDGNDLFQLAVNKSRVIRGNYYNAIGDITLPVYGSVDEKTQRAAWTVGDRKDPVFEAGFANLTRSETTMLVHWGKDRPRQWTLVRIEQPAEKAAGPGRPGESDVRASSTFRESSR